MFPETLLDFWNLLKLDWISGAAQGKLQIIFFKSKKRQQMLSKQIFIYSWSDISAKTQTKRSYFIDYHVVEIFGQSFIFYMNFYYSSNVKFMMAHDPLEILTLILPQNSIIFCRKNGKV